MMKTEIQIVDIILHMGLGINVEIVNTFILCTVRISVLMRLLLSHLSHVHVLNSANVINMKYWTIIVGTSVVRFNVLHKKYTTIFTKFNTYHI